MGKKILLADDSITIQKVIELTFSDEDFEVVTVGNGRLAIEKVGEVRPDIVLCDIIMPEKDGYEVCDFIKKHPTLSSVPVLLLTGAFEPFDQERATRVGCDGFLAKPFEPATLIGKVKDLLYQAGARRAAPAAAPPAPAAAPVMSAPQAYVPPSPPEPMMFPIEPPLVATIDEVAPEESPVSFIPDTPVMEDLAAPMVGEDSGAASLLEQELYGVGQAVETAPEEYMPVTPEEVETLSAPADTSTVVFRAGESPWGDPAPLEPFAAPSPGAVETSAPAFEEVFEEELPAAATAFEPVIPPLVVAPETVPVPEPVIPAPAEAPMLHALPQEEEAQHVLPPEVSFADVAPAPPEPPPPAPPSEAANVAVPVEMVAQIAQRVVSQISERVVREVAWEVIPDLAEALIKKEIERLKAEIQNT
jgi:CheY-like chemotaxis protein